MYDAVVVGARCAGAPVAMLLARRGYRVLLVDRATFPSDIPHGHLIHRHGPGRLHRWGLLDRVVATNCPPVSTMALDLGDFPLVGRDLVVNGVAAAYGPRRSALDQVLVEAAVEAGAELRTGVTIESFTTEGDRVTGIRCRERQRSGPITEQAAIVVGADGRRSRLAQFVDAPMSEATPPVTCWYFSYWSDVPGSALEITLRERRVAFAFPTNDRLFALFIAWPADQLPTVRADIEREFMAVVDRIPDLAQRVRAGRREEPFYGATDLPNYLRKPYGPGWALVGDAGCHKDPFLALGVCDALRDAELLAEAIDEGLSGRRPLDDALETYERRRNAATRADYKENIRMARFEPLPPDALRLRAALRGNQSETNRFFLAREGMLPPETFFNPEHLGRIMAHAAAVPATSTLTAAP